MQTPLNSNWGFAIVFSTAREESPGAFQSLLYSGSSGVEVPLGDGCLLARWRFAMGGKFATVISSKILRELKYGNQSANSHSKRQELLRSVQIEIQT